MSARQPLRYFIRKICWSLLALFVLLNVAVVGLVTFVYYRPGVAWDFAHDQFLPKDLEIQWRGIHHRMTSSRWSEWSLMWEVDGLRILKGEPSLSVPLDRVRVDVSLDLLALRLVVHELRVESSEPILYEPKPEAKASEQSLYQRFRTVAGELTSLQRLTVLEQLRVEVADVRVGPGPLRLKLKVFKEDRESSRLNFAMGLKGLTKEWTVLNLSGGLELNEFKTERPFLFVKASAQGESRAQVEGELAFVRSRAQMKFRGALDIHHGQLQLHVQPKLLATLSRSELAIQLVTDVSGLPQLDQVQDAKVQIVIPQQDGVLWSAQPSRVEVSLPLEWDRLAKGLRPTLEGSCQCALPKRVTLSAQAKVWLKAWLEPTEETVPALEAQVQLEDVTNKVFGLQVAGGFNLAHGAHATEIAPTLQVDAVLFSYQGLRRYLDKQGILIPAPLSVLDGTVRVAAHGPVQVSEAGYRVPLSLDVNLRSEHQDVQLTSQLTVRADRRFERVDVDVKAKVKSLILELPPLEPIRGVPRLARDSRVRLKAPTPSAKAVTKFKLALSVEVETEAPGAIRLLSKLADPYLPITVHVQKTASTVEGGQVRIEPFKIRYLRRTVNVEFFKLDVHPLPAGDFPIEGRLRVDQSDYKVFIAIHGTTGAPQFELSSEPFLPRDDIISVLLYDRVSSQLVSADAETAGSFQAAMADRAIGLFGLWAFAMTPIRSFSYNSLTKVYTATVQLADGLTAGVGTDWEHAAHLEVRKRVSQRWVLTASYSPSDDQRDVGKVVLQWEKRF